MISWRLAATILLVALALTGFYLVHETLPLALRAPSSLILTGVAVASLVGASLGVDVYGSLPLVFLANLVASAVVILSFVTIRQIIVRRRLRE